MAELTKDFGKAEFGGFVMAMFTNAKPELKDANVEHKFKNRSLTLVVGPSVSFTNAKFRFSGGIGISFAGYKLDATSGGIKTPLKSKNFRTIGAMPFVKAEYLLKKNIGIFAFAGHNFSKKAKIKDADPVLNGRKIKTGTTLIGAGISVKI